VKLHDGRRPRRKLGLTMASMAHLGPSYTAHTSISPTSSSSSIAAESVFPFTELGLSYQWLRVSQKIAV